jgi:hypothetical protein
MSPAPCGKRASLGRSLLPSDWSSAHDRKGDQALVGRPDDRRLARLRSSQPAAQAPGSRLQRRASVRSGTARVPAKSERRPENVGLGAPDVLCHRGQWLVGTADLLVAGVDVGALAGAGDRDIGALLRLAPAFMGGFAGLVRCRADVAVPALGLPAPGQQRVPVPSAVVADRAACRITVGADVGLYSRGPPMSLANALMFLGASDQTPQVLEAVVGGSPWAAAGIRFRRTSSRRRRRPRRAPGADGLECAPQARNTRTAP